MNLKDWMSESGERDLRWSVIVGSRSESESGWGGGGGVGSRGGGGGGCGPRVGAWLIKRMVCLGVVVAMAVVVERLGLDELGR